jgi:hypothetical protein
LRKPSYLSPSAFVLWKQNREEYIKKYIIEPAPPRFAQTVPMALGSSFDAFCKNELVRCVYGGAAVALGTDYHLETLFKKQVDEEHQAWAWEAGGKLFLTYKDLGSFDELLAEINMATVKPQFEVPLQAEINGVPLKGYPDCFYRLPSTLVILDWKCNGYSGTRKMSPCKNYIRERPNGRSHKNVSVITEHGIELQNEHCFSLTDEKWASQMVIYGWMLGEPIGSQFPVQIEQMLMEPDNTRSVTYRGYVSKEFQTKLITELGEAWDVIKSGHFYPELSLEDSNLKLARMEKLAIMQANGNTLLDIVARTK